MLTCHAPGRWSAPPPVCVPATCPPPAPPQHGKVQGAARRHGDSVLYTCELGYTLLGPRVRTCSSRGTWMPEQPPRCAAITCPPLPPLPHGAVSSPELRVPGERARFRCWLGWRLTGSSNLTCATSGQWEGALPSCEPAHCSLDTAATNASLAAPQQPRPRYPVGAEVAWECGAGLGLAGAATTVCLATGAWDQPAPVCVRRECREVLAVTNGVVFGTRVGGGGDTEVRWSCDHGYYKVPHSGLSCTLAGEWAGPVPVCSRHECPALAPPPHGALVTRPTADGLSYAAHYSCGPAHQLVGPSVVSCAAPGSWDLAPPRCELAFCVVAAPAPGLARPQRTRLGDTAQFRCEAGLELVGERFVRCLASGRWERPLPRCRPRLCSSLQRLRHGALILEPSPHLLGTWTRTHSGQGWEEVRAGDTLTASCDPGYEVAGPRQVTCLPSGQLQPAQLPRCRASYCRAPPSPRHGRLVRAATYRGATVTATCDPGYRLAGGQQAATRTCRRNKTWSGARPRCEVVTCAPPHDIAHGRLETSDPNMEYGAVASYSCHLGYEIVGPATRVCGGEGAWQGGEPECVQVRCAVPRIPVHGEQEVRSLLVGGTAHYRCSPGYRLHGATVLSCLGNRTWSQPAPTCELLQCPAPAPPQHGAVVSAGGGVEARLQYSCHPGYSLQGHHSASCLPTGRWSRPAPRCVATLCPRLDISHAQVETTSGLGPGSLARVSCVPGYQLEGAGQLVCQVSLDWRPAPPSCRPLTCGDPPPADNAVAHADGFSYMDTANYTCLPGYEKRVNIFCI